MRRERRDRILDSLSDKLLLLPLPPLFLYHHHATVSIPPPTVLQGIETLYTTLHHIPDQLSYTQSSHGKERRVGRQKGVWIERANLDTTDTQLYEKWFMLKLSVTKEERS
jgi:hypothetical protein